MQEPPEAGPLTLKPSNPLTPISFPHALLPPVPPPPAPSHRGSAQSRSRDNADPVAARAPPLRSAGHKPAHAGVVDDWSGSDVGGRGAAPTERAPKPRRRWR